MKNYLILVIVLFALSCKEKVNPSSTCNVGNPTEDLAWLKAEIDRREKSQSDLKVYFFIEQGEHNNQTVFLYNNCCPMCSTVGAVYDCSGTKLFDLGPGVDISDIKNLKVIWKPEGCLCQST